MKGLTRYTGEKWKRYDTIVPEDGRKKPQESDSEWGTVSEDELSETGINERDEKNQPSRVKLKMLDLNRTRSLVFNSDENEPEDTSGTQLGHSASALQSLGLSPNRGPVSRVPELSTIEEESFARPESFSMMDALSETESTGSDDDFFKPFEEEPWKMGSRRPRSGADFRETGPWTPTPVEAGSDVEPELSAAPSVENAEDSFRDLERFEEEPWTLGSRRPRSGADFRETGPWTPTPAEAGSDVEPELSAASSVENAEDSFRDLERFEEEPWKMGSRRPRSGADFRETGPWTSSTAEAGSDVEPELSAASSVENSEDSFRDLERFEEEPWKMGSRRPRSGADFVKLVLGHRLQQKLVQSMSRNKVLHRL